MKTIILISTLILMSSCVIPRTLWPQKDVVEQSSSNARILIASRSSEFKDAVVNKTALLLQNDSIPVRIVGLNSLDTIKVDGYKAILLVNTCVAWDLDRNINTFLEKVGTTNNIIIFTTAGDSLWSPPKDNHAYDAITSASIMSLSDVRAAMLAGKIKTLLSK